MDNQLEEQINTLQAELQEKRKELNNLKRKRVGVKIEDYTFRDKENNEVNLFSLFDERDELLIIHNMGKGCAYCTLWADGFNGFSKHLSQRLPWYVSSPDSVEDMNAFASSRDWDFNMLSSNGNTFKKDMGFATDKGPMPGFSVFHRQSDGSVYHTSFDSFGPGDLYMPMFHLLELLPKGVDDWNPRKAY